MSNNRNIDYTQEFYNHSINIDKYVEIFALLDTFNIKLKDKDKKNLVLYIVNLLCSDNGKIAIIRSHEWFDENIHNDWHTIRLAIKAQKILLDRGLVTCKVGYRSEGYSKGFASVLTATKKFYKIFGKIEIRNLEVTKSEIFDIIYKESVVPEDIPEEYAFKPYENKTSFKVIDEKKYYIETKENIHIFKKKKPSIIEIWLKKMYVLNYHYFDKIVLGFDYRRKKVNMVTNVYLTRVFTKEGCGRFYQKGGISYQIIKNKKKKQRKHLTINGLPTVEVDFSSFHINLLYAEEKIQNKLKDCYMPIVKKLIKKNNEELRGAIKECTLIAINATNFKSFVGATNSKKELYATLHKFNVKPKMIKEAFSEVHPSIIKHLNTNASIGLQYKDSNIIQEVLLKLKKENILGVPLHDSIITQKDKGQRVKEIMEQTYKQMTGYTITATIKK